MKSKQGRTSHGPVAVVGSGGYVLRRAMWTGHLVWVRGFLRARLVDADGNTYYERTDFLRWL